MAKVYSPITLNNVATQNASFVTQNLARSIEHFSHKYLSHEFSKSARREIAQYLTILHQSLKWQHRKICCAKHLTGKWFMPNC